MSILHQIQYLCSVKVLVHPKMNVIWFSRERMSEIYAFMNFLDLESFGYMDCKWRDKNLPGFIKKKCLDLCPKDERKVLWVRNDLRVSN